MYIKVVWVECPTIISINILSTTLMMNVTKTMREVMDVEAHLYTLQKFWRYNKVHLGELIPLEILGDH